MEATAIATVTAKIERASATKAMASVETALLKDDLPKTGKALKDTIAQSVSYELAKQGHLKRPSQGILRNPKHTKRTKPTPHPNSEAAGTRPPAANNKGNTKSNNGNNHGSSRKKSNHKNNNKLRSAP
jgi:hypothetical protein